MANLLFDALIGAGAPDATAIESAGVALTYAGLQAQTAQAAAALSALGVRPGDRVAAQVEKSVAALVLWLASVRAGAVFLPLNPAYTDAELAHFLGDAEPTVVICGPARRSGIAAIAGKAAVETLDGSGEGSFADGVRVQAADFPAVAREAGDLAALCYTSGTTGRSKGAMLTHGNLLSNGRTLAEAWRFTAADRLIHALPLFHVHGLFIAVHVPMLAGARIALHPKFDPAAVLAAMAEGTVLMGVPTFYTRLLAQEGLTPAAAAAMRLFISGSAPLLADTHRAFEARIGHAILERYGMTETGMLTSNPYDGPRVAGTVGPPLADVSLRIADPATGAPLPRGEVGGIEVKGPNVFAGYWRLPEKTAAEFRPDGFFITGDLGVQDDAGVVTIVGRDKDLIISGGLNVYPKEVESAIDALPGVIESAVIGLPHPDFGEAVTAVVVGTGEEAAVLAALAGSLASFKRPRRVLFVDELPRNAMGKVQKAALRARHAALYR